MNQKRSALPRTIATLVAIGTFAALSATATQAQEAQIESAAAIVVDGEGKQIGIAGFSDTGNGTKLVLAITGVAPGMHGVHIHTNGSCEDSTNDQGQVVTFGGAGGHFDPHSTGHHGGPETASDDGHAGDLPNIEVGPDGRGVLEVVTDKVTLSAGPLSIAGRSIVIHANPDNYTDEPALGGSGPRIACGVILAI